MWRELEINGEVGLICVSSEKNVFEEAPWKRKKRVSDAGHALHPHFAERSEAADADFELADAALSRLAD